MSTYVLIHGAWHGGWCWNKVAPLLDAAGHTVVTPDLPGLGDDPTAPADVTMDVYSEHVCKVLDAQTEPSILLGHSMGGMPISQAAERRPDGVKVLVYLTATLLKNGQSAFDVVADDQESQVLPNIIPSADEITGTVRDEAVKEVFYADCSDADVERAKSLFKPQAMGVMSEPMTLSDENFGRVPRVFIECLQDRALTPALQKKMYDASPCRSVISMDASHSPFFSMPEQLAAHLLTL